MRILFSFLFALMTMTAMADDMMSWPVPTGPITEMTYTPSATRFSLWSPKADSVRVNIYPDATHGAVMFLDMKAQNDGTWEVTIPGNCAKLFYTFQVKVKGKWQAETPGIFAKAVGINGQRAQVIDMRTTDPAGWQQDQSPRLTSLSDVVLYEMHHRDMSVNRESGITHKGKFLAMTEHGTHNGDGLSTGIDHLADLGVTHVHLLPSYDYGSIDEATGNALGGGNRVPSTYNWGYDPVNYNAPEGSYSTNAADPSARIREFKEMVMAMHKAGLRVVMDVVYNHVFDLGQSNFQKTAPDYFFRWKQQDGKLVPANGSGCGNETASERPMMRKFIVESVMYWMREYHIDGFRFDLMGIHDIETMNAVREAARTIDPNVVIYGEGWAAESPALDNQLLAMKANTSQLNGIAAFGDEMRDGLRGGWQDDKQGAFLIGNSGNEESVKFGIVGAIRHPGIDYTKVNYSQKAWADEPTQMISYVSCHDDMCLADRIKVTLAEKLKAQSTIAKGKGTTKGKANAAKGKTATAATATEEEQRVRLHKLAETVVLTSQGMPFLWCGDEVMRDKKGVHNSFSSPDDINEIPWALKTEHKDVYEYIRELIRMRKEHKAFHMGDADEVRENLRFLSVTTPNIIAYQLNGAAVGDSWKQVTVILNSNATPQTVSIPKGKYTVVCSDGRINLNGLGGVNGKKVVVPAQSALIMIRN